MFTGPNGSFQIDNVPAGTYTLSIESNGIVLGTMPDVIVGSDPVSVGNVLLSDTQHDRNNCGACGTVCGAGLSCVNGTCQQEQLCVPGSIRSCYTGPPGTQNVGVCSAGTQVCNAQGSAYGACTGETVPMIEACDGIDNDCDGVIDENCQAQCSTPADCPGVTDACQTRTCIAGVCGLGFTSVGTVVGAQIPGDCRVNVCDGNGGVMATPDNTDIPADDGNVCTQQVCVNGVPTFPPAPNGTVCQSGSCIGGTQTLPSTCNGFGTCTVGITVNCAPYVCGANSCRTSCNNDGDCAAGNTCFGNQCVAKLVQGAACSQPGQCQSGNCVDGFCCNTACTGTCEACSVAKRGGGVNGSCGFIVANTDPDGECDGNGVCNGAGACFDPASDLLACVNPVDDALKPWQ